MNWIQRPRMLMLVTAMGIGGLETAAVTHGCVLTIHHARPWSREDRRKRAMTFLAGRLAHAVVVSSNATRATVLQAGVPAAKVHVVPIGIRQPKQLISGSAARAQLGL